jgi:hypothetical protein
MANVLSLAMKISADATGVRQSLSSVERAIIQLDKETSSITAAFDKFASTSSKAAEVQRTFQTRLEALNNALKSGAITDAREYTAALAQLSAEAKNAADRVGEAEAITRRFRTEQQRQTAELELYNQRFQEGLLNQETYNAAAIESLGINKLAADAARQRADALAEAERSAAKAFDSQLAAESAEAAKASAAAEKERADAVARAAEIVTANLTKEQLATRTYEQSVAELNRLRSLGVLGEEDYGRALQRSANDFAKATIEANKLADATDKIGDGGTLKFNELSGILAALPGPIGNVAGRLSGLASAGEGLSRVFGAGLSQGLSSIGASVAGLINPFTAAVAGVAGFGAAAAQVAQGLAVLDDRVEKLGNTADKLGVSFEFIQTLDESARRSGTSIESVSAAFGRLQRSVLGVDEESKAAQKALAEIGVTAAELQALRPEDQYQLIGERIRSIEDPARRTATAINLFGRAGSELVPFFNNIGGAADDMERFGATLSTAQRRDIDEFGAAMDKLSVAAGGAGNQIIASFTPAGIAIANALATATGAITRFGQEQNRLAAFSRELQKLREQIGEVQAGPISDAQRDAIAAGQTAEQVLAAAKGQVVELKKELEAPPTPEFLKSIEDITKQIEKAKEESLEFGKAGFDAAEEYERALQGVAEDFKAGFIDVDEFRSQTKLAGEAFRDELSNISDNAKLEIQVDAATEQTLADLNAEVDKAIRGAQEFGQEGFDAALKFQTKVGELRGEFGRGIINDEALKQGVAAVNAEYDKQISKLRDVQAEQKRIIEEDKRRVEQLLAVQDDAARVEEAILGVQREAQRVAVEINAARQQGNQQAAAAGAAQLAQIDQLQARLEDNLQAAEQGFGEAGFGPAFEQINQQLGGMADRAAEFGNAGAVAFDALKQGVADAQEQARDGVLNKEGLEQQVAAQQRAFEKELKNIEDAAEKRKQVQADVDRLIFDSLDKQQQAQIEAAENLQKLEQEKVAAQEAVARAREGGDKKALADANLRLQQIDALAKRERDVADGTAARREAFQDRQRKLAEAQAKQQEELLQQQQKAAEERAKAEQAEFDRQERRLTELNTLGPRQVQTADVRTQEGQQLVLDLFNQQQDPQLIQLRSLNKVMGRIAASIDRDLNRLGQPVAIL